jgi:hypothetical protein
MLPKKGLLQSSETLAEAIFSRIKGSGSIAKRRLEGGNGSSRVAESEWKPLGLFFVSNALPSPMLCVRFLLFLGLQVASAFVALEEEFAVFFDKPNEAAAVFDR